MKTLLKTILIAALLLSACTVGTRTPTSTPLDPTQPAGSSTATVSASRLQDTPAASPDPYLPPGAVPPVEPPPATSELAETLPAGAYPPPDATATTAQGDARPTSTATINRSAVTPSLTATTPSDSSLPTPTATVNSPFGETAVIPTSTGAANPYPGPGTPSGPGATPTASATLGGQTPSPSATSPAGTAIPTASATSPAGTVIPTPTEVITPTPTEKPNLPLETPPPIAGTVTLWHSWGETETLALETIIEAFQDTYPDVRFDVLYVPHDNLLDRFETAAYTGGGPALLLGPADWGPGLFDQDFLTDLTPFSTAQFLATINPAALGSGRYHGALIGLPYAQRGVVLYRNKTIIPNASASWDDLRAAAQAATTGGKVGAFFERSSFFSAAHLNGIGGYLMDANGNPTFNNASGVEWLDLLSAFDDLGATTFNSDRDVQLFKEGKAGLIIEASWRRFELAEAIGADNLAIDPWPAYGNGHLSGFVQTDNLFLNANTDEDDQLAALRFIGFLLAPEVQARLAEAGFIPSVSGVTVTDPFIQSAAAAFERGTPYPLVVSSDDLPIYWTALDAAIADVINYGADPVAALQQAYETITANLP